MCSLLLHLVQLVDLDYTIVYFHYGLRSNNKPPLKWLHRAYQMLDRRYKKNLKALFLVHPTRSIASGFLFQIIIDHCDQFQVHSLRLEHLPAVHISGVVYASLFLTTSTGNSQTPWNNSRIVPLSPVLWYTLCCLKSLLKRVPLVVASENDFFLVHPWTGHMNSECCASRQWLLNTSRSENNS